MNKLLSIVLMLSAIATVVPAHAVQTRRQERLAAQAQHQNNDNALRSAESDDDIEESPSLGQDESSEEQSPVIQNKTSMFSRRALIAAAAIGTVATATYLYATATDCTSVAQAYCAGKASAQALSACGVYWPMVPVVGCLFQ